MRTLYDGSFFFCLVCLVAMLKKVAAVSGNALSAKVGIFAGFWVERIKARLV